jgi:hypothetical protein
MAQKQSEWPRVKRNPTACYQTSDGLYRSDREVAGPLRMGTHPTVGPRGRGVSGAGRSDYGMDRAELPPVDRVGVKYPEVDPPVRFISEEIRSGYRQGRRRR